MWNTFVVTLKSSVREKSALFWMVAFPLILATLFNAMFSKIADSYTMDTLNVAVVEDANWNKYEYARGFVKGIAGMDTESGDVSLDDSSKDDADTPLMNLKMVDDLAAAETAMRDDGFDGVITVDADGRLHLAVSSTTAAQVNDATDADSKGITLTVAGNLIARYNQADATIRHILETNPAALSNPSVSKSLWSYDSFTHEVSLTHFKPDPIARYYYASFGMVSLMSMTFAIYAIAAAQANLSALGMRRTVSPLPKWRQIAAGFLASWLCSFLSLVILFLYVRFVCGIAVGGREPVVVVALAVASFMPCALGVFIGALPKLSTATKSGIAVAISCFLSLFAGLYGMFAMDLSDNIARNAPVLDVLNPAKQVSNLFYDLLYFDSYVPFLKTAGILLAFSAVFLAGAGLLLRRQRYDYL